jgi:hypothetical protein
MSNASDYTSIALGCQSAVEIAGEIKKRMQIVAKTAFTDIIDGANLESEAVGWRGGNENFFPDPSLINCLLANRVQTGRMSTKRSSNEALGRGSRHCFL